MNLRHVAHTLKPVVQIGKDGVTDNVIEQVRLALKKKRIIKVRCTPSVQDKKAALDILVSKINCKVVHKIGGTITIAEPRYYLVHTR
jgi:RNA-binding protein